MATVESKGISCVGDNTVTQTSCHSFHLGPDGEHVPCGISSFTGTITSGSGDTYSGGRRVAREGDSVNEVCSCCGGGTGTLSGGSNTCYVNGKRIIRKGDSVISHNGNIGTVV